MRYITHAHCIVSIALRQLCGLPSTVTGQYVCNKPLIFCSCAIVVVCTPSWFSFLECTWSSCCSWWLYHCWVISYLVQLTVLLRSVHVCSNNIIVCMCVCVDWLLCAVVMLVFRLLFMCVSQFMRSCWFCYYSTVCRSSYSSYRGGQLPGVLHRSLYTVVFATAWCYVCCIDWNWYWLRCSISWSIEGDLC